MYIILSLNQCKTNFWPLNCNYFAFQVIPRNGILIVFDVDNEFWIYVHDRGEEYYLHYDFWPTVPFIHRSVTNEYFSDIVVRKELEIHQDNCSEENYDYFGKFGIYGDLISIIATI